MAFNERLVTVAIHTCERALELKDKLENEGLYVTLQNINLEHPVISSGMRVRIKESDLPKALLIIENDECRAAASPQTRNDAEILVPIDFSDYSLEAYKVALNLAELHNASLTLLYAYMTSHHASTMQLSNALTYDAHIPAEETEAEEQAHRNMALFRAKISAELTMHGSASIPVREVIAQGIPEEVINQYSKKHSPLLIIMGTRGADKKERELIGSVTAEVLDSCRRPVITVPEGYSASDILSISKVLFFSNGEQCDILALQRMQELIKCSFNDITLAHLQPKRNIGFLKDNLEALRKYCTEHYPEINFSTTIIPIPASEDTANKVEPESNIGLIVIPSKRKSAFARIFNPGIAHKLLFRADIPMMVIPV